MPEKIELKKKVFQQLDDLATDDVVLSSSSSAIPSSKFTEDLKHRSQCIVSHPVSLTIVPCFLVTVYLRSSILH